MLSLPIILRMDSVVSIQSAGSDTGLPLHVLSILTGYIRRVHSPHGRIDTIRMARHVRGELVLWKSRRISSNLRSNSVRLKRAPVTTVIRIRPSGFRGMGADATFVRAKPTFVRITQAIPTMMAIPVVSRRRRRLLRQRNFWKDLMSHSELQNASEEVCVCVCVCACVCVSKQHTRSILFYSTFKRRCGSKNATKRTV